MCKRCGRDDVEMKGHICVECEKAENSRVSHYRQHNYNWMEVAKEAGIELWERQPEETDREWQIWLTYRDAYPGKKPSYRDVAEQLGTTINVVKKAGQRWSFPTRLQAWAKYCDELTMQQRQQEIVEMNKTHIDMANKINEKLQKAIDNIRPEEMDPKEIQGLFKLANEVERKARLETPDVYKPSVGDENPELKKPTVDGGSLKEVLNILQKTGALGVRQTTEVIHKNE